MLRAVLLLCAAAAAQRPYAELAKLLKQNKDSYDPSWTPPGLPPAAFQDHIAYDLVTLYRLGANASRLDAAYAYHEQTEMLAKAVPASGKVTADNWQAQIGADPQTLSLYSDYVEYYRGQLAGGDVRKVLDAHMPALVDGVFGKLFHGMLAVGWVYAEAGSRDTEALAQGLGWMSSAFSPPIPLGAAVKPGKGALAATFDAMRADKALPTFQGDPQSLYFVFLGDLCANHSATMQAYDLDFHPSASLKEAVAVTEDMSAAMLDLFAANNYTSYTHVHMIEAVRAVRNMLPMVSAAPRATLLRRLWQAVLFNFAIQSRPASAAPGPDVVLRDWDLLRSGAMAQGDTHLHNIVWVAYDTAKQPGSNAALYHTAAERAVALFEAGGTWAF